MSFLTKFSQALKSLISKFLQAVKLPAWLQFVGYMLAFLFLLAFALHIHDRVTVIGCGVAIAISITGFVFEKIYT